MQKSCYPVIQATSNLTPTTCDTEYRQTTVKQHTSDNPTPSMIETNNVQAPHIIPFDFEDDEEIYTVPPSDNISDGDLPQIIRNITTTVEPPFYISLSHNPFKFLCSFNDNYYEEIYAYNDIIRHVEKDNNDPDIWKFKQIIAHEGTLERNHLNYKGCP